MKKTRGMLFLTVIIVVLSMSFLPASAGTVHYEYDDLNRLVNIEYEKIDEVKGTEVKYTYDDTGNRKSEEVVVPDDADGDGTADDLDNCPSVPNPDQLDTDGDGVGDLCDNCVDVPNPDQADSDGNGIGDACETVFGDLDGDGDVDRDDVSIIQANRNMPADVCPECDIDGDGTITVLDARKLMLMCTCPRCICE
ncbi:MAG: hypothetical protein GY795_43400 [Desulfobacterales bacterium]|nr:hypothetical protein [Desulfobacterales bacterium]